MGALVQPPGRCVRTAASSRTAPASTASCWPPATVPAHGEIHVAVVGGFHLTIVRLPDWARARHRWARGVIAVGPMLRARDGQREVQAFKVVRG